MLKYHPCSKEFQEEAKRLGLTGNQLIQKYTKEGKLQNPTDINRNNNERISKQAGFKNHNEYELNRCHKNMERKRKYLREWRYENGIQLPMSENKDCAKYLGIYIAERKIGRMILPEMLGTIKEEMPQNYPKYDFIVAEDIKVDVKSCCLREIDNWKGWEPHTRYNNIADYFIIVAFDNRNDLNIMHIWLIYRDEIIRGDKFYRRYGIKMTNKPRYLLEFKRFDWINKLECIKNRTWS